MNADITNDNNEGCGDKLSEWGKQQLMKQNTQLVSEFRRNQLESNTHKFWDIFYKNHKTGFFKDRHWLTREFPELTVTSNLGNIVRHLEVGCGVGNLVFPLISNQNENQTNRYYYLCDVSKRAIEHVKSNGLYNEQYMNAFLCDITTLEVHNHIDPNTLDTITLIFVLSAINPNKHDSSLQNLWKLLNHNGILLFRDYGIYDMAQLRFKPGNKISENFYVRQDGTYCYYFSTTVVNELFKRNGFEILNCEYVYRRTTNAKEGIDVLRTFVQGTFKKVDK